VTLIWATRGYSWGFRFLRRGDSTNPLAEYESAFATLDDQAEVCRRLGDQVALRFPDPESRRDASGRLIPHEFVITGPLANEVSTVDDGRRRVWPLVSDEFEAVWLLPAPPPGR
jgi:hypothetical protein